MKRSVSHNGAINKIQSPISNQKMSSHFSEEPNYVEIYLI